MPQRSPTWGGAGGGGGPWAGRAQLSHSSGAEKALLGALSLFRQEMSADWPADAIAGWRTGRGGVGDRRQLGGLWGRQSPQTWTPWVGGPTPGEKNHPLSNNNKNNSSYHSWGTYCVQGTVLGQLVEIQQVSFFCPLLYPQVLTQHWAHCRCFVNPCPDQMNIHYPCHSSRDPRSNSGGS